MNIMKTLLVGAALVGFTSATNAATVFHADGFANQVVTGPTDQPGVRDNPANAFGASDGVFYSLTLGGSIDLSFDSNRTFNPDQRISAFEVTFGNLDTHIEEVRVETVLGGLVTSVVGTLTNAAAQAGAGLRITTAFDALRFVDISPIGGGSTDGFDLDSVSVSAVPLPAGGLLLIGGLAGLGALRARKKKS